eukprot:1755348-Prymnesium_polylepis.1
MSPCSDCAQPEHFWSALAAISQPVPPPYLYRLPATPHAHRPCVSRTARARPDTAPGSRAPVPSHRTSVPIDGRPPSRSDGDSPMWSGT